MALTDNQNIIDINIDGIEKTKFRINGGDIIELNLSDLGITDRLNKGVKKLEDEMREIANLPESEDFAEKLAEADKSMKECIDYIFDSPVSAVCAKGGTMYDPINGMFRYERILDALTKLYKDNINAEYKKIHNRIEKHTDKYTKIPATTKKGKKK